MAEAGRREKFGFAFEATREISDQLWGSPTLAKSRIWGFMAHMWKISAQTNAFIFSPNNPKCSCNPADLRRFLGCFVKRILECFLLSPGVDVACPDCEKGKAWVFNWISSENDIVILWGYWESKPKWGLDEAPTCWGTGSGFLQEKQLPRRSLFLLLSV